MGHAGKLEWNDEMLTGVLEIDQQHRVLVDILIDAESKLNSAAAESPFEQLTRDLLAYAIYHFDTEEQLMQRHGYVTAIPDEAAQHLAAHRRFSEQVVSLRAEVRLGRGGAQAALLSFLKDWLVEHILNTDKRLGRFICDAAQASPAITP